MNGWGGWRRSRAGRVTTRNLKFPGRSATTSVPRGPTRAPAVPAQGGVLDGSVSPRGGSCRFPGDEPPPSPSSRGKHLSVRLAPPTSLHVFDDERIGEREERAFRDTDSALARLRSRALEVSKSLLRGHRWSTPQVVADSSGRQPAPERSLGTARSISRGPVPHQRTRGDRCRAMAAGGLVEPGDRPPREVC